MEKNIEALLPKKLKVNELPLLSLAFLGDAVHTLFIRTALMENGMQTSGNLHKRASALCSANGQSQMLDAILGILTEEEADVVRRARNTKTHKPPKSADLETYKKATSFECLVGWLWAKGEVERVLFLAQTALEKGNL